MPPTPSRKRKRASRSVPPTNDHDKQAATPDEVSEHSVAQPRELTEEEYDLQQHRKMYEKRNFDKVIFGTWQIKTWCVCILIVCMPQLNLFQVLLTVPDK